MLNLKGKIFSLEKTPLVMGILNLTPDSFYDGGRYNSQSLAIKRTEEMLEQGANIIDVGAQSTRPFAEKLSVDEEIERLKPILPSLIKNFPNAIFSIDTYYGKVAEFAADCGVALINDVSGGEWDEQMLTSVKKLNLPYVLTHSKGSPQQMQKLPHGDDVVDEVAFYFSQKIAKLHDMGINDVILDPGIGFGKTIDHNYQLLNELHHFLMFNKPIMVGLSRKSFIFKTLDKNASEVLCPTMALHLKCLESGVSILRSHDVADTMQIIRIFHKSKIQKKW